VRPVLPRGSICSLGRHRFVLETRSRKSQSQAPVPQENLDQNTPRYLIKASPNSKHSQPHTSSTKASFVETSFTKAISAIKIRQGKQTHITSPHYPHRASFPGYVSLPQLQSTNPRYVSFPEFVSRPRLRSTFYVSRRDREVMQRPVNRRGVKRRFRSTRRGYAIRETSIRAWKKALSPERSPRTP
jgi:hypothetical protein